MGLFDWFFKPNVQRLEREKDVERLIKALLYENDLHVRCDAAEALGRIKDPRAIEPLISALKNSNFWLLQEIVVGVLSNFKDSRVDEAIKWYRDVHNPAFIGDPFNPRNEVKKRYYIG